MVCALAALLALAAPTLWWVTSAEQSYPEYCSKPADMEARGIPPLSPTALAMGPQILQAQVLIRHGARTPFAAYTCWHGYGEKWDCDTYMLIAQLPGETRAQASWLFRKVYDALQFPAANLLQGTCHVGQLLKDGVWQEVANGQHLREAYLGDNGQSALRLFNTTRFHDLPPNSTRFRGDDQQRTLMSGQILVNALFDLQENTLVDWHTADFAVDPIYPNTAVCPRLQELNVEAAQSAEFQQANASFPLNAELEALGTNWNILLDCLGTSRCNGRPLPTMLDDYAPNTPSNYSRVWAHGVWQYNFQLRYQQARAAKLASAPLLEEVRQAMSAARHARPEQLVKLLLYSAHDTSLLAVLEALGANSNLSHWPPYASMLILETHSLAIPDTSRAWPSHAFRLLYNGDVITNRIAGCCTDNASSLCAALPPGEPCHLCDADVLLSLLGSFATWNRTQACAATQPPPPATPAQCFSTGQPDPGSVNQLTDIQWFFLLLLCSTLSAAICPRMHSPSAPRRVPNAGGACLDDCCCGLPARLFHNTAFVPLADLSHHEDMNLSQLEGEEGLGSPARQQIQGEAARSPE
eukprot:g29759.t1